jgi:hypothetical protein
MDIFQPHASKDESFRGSLRFSSPALAIADLQTHVVKYAREKRIT